MKNTISTIIILTLILISISTVSAVCTVTLDKESYNQKETITAQMTCSGVAEKLDDYNLTWTNQTGAILEIDSGITPAQVDTNFFQTYIIPSDYVSENGINITATLSGGDTEGSDFANVTTASSSSLIITDIEITSDVLIGKLVSATANIIDENDKKIDNALCRIKVLDENNKPVNTLPPETSINGEISFSTTVSSKSLDEGAEYVFGIDCTCGIENTSIGCYDEDGASISPSTGGVEYPVSMGTWLTVNTVTNKDLYEIIDQMTICANITNPENRDRQELHIIYTYRCDGNDSGTNRILIDTHSEHRAISANKTQMQCNDFYIPIDNIIEQGATECYASTDVSVLDKAGDVAISYHTLSPQFNITIDHIHIEPKWFRTNRTNYFSNITYDNFDVGVKDIHIIMKNSDFGGFGDFKDVENYSVYYSNGTKFTGETSLFHHVHPFRINTRGGAEDVVIERDFELEIIGVNTTLEENFTVYIDFVNFEERQTDALEGIENKTGTFHLDVECPIEAPIGEEMDCAITAYIEETQLVEKEVDFTCYIQTEEGRLSSSNFNQMITRTNQTFHRKFLVQENLAENKEYVLQCEAGYYNFGSRIDTFYDTFIVTDPREGEEEIGGLPSVVEAEEEKGILEKTEDKITKIINEGLPLYVNIIISIVILFVILFIICVVIIVVKNKRRKRKDL